MDITSVVASIPGLVIGIFSLMQKRLLFDIFSYNLIDSKKIPLSKMKVYYSEENVEKLTASKIVFWNSAFQHIDKADISTTAPLTIELNEGKILDITVVKGDKSPTMVSVSREGEKKAIFSFDYLNRKKGGIIQIIHTGDEDSINISGEIKGGYITTFQGKHSFVLRILRMIMFSFFFFLFALIFIIFAPPNMIMECRRVYLETVPEKYGIINLQNFLFISIMLMFSGVFAFFQEKNNFIPTNCRDKKKNKSKR